MGLVLPVICTLFAALGFLALERIAPGRKLPATSGWYPRALLVSAAHIAVTVGTNHLWFKLFSGSSLLRLARLQVPLAEGFVAWLAGTFVFYWWHRIRHLSGFWEVFHQLHHSPSRIETLTSLYKHPLEIVADAVLAAALLYAALGISMTGALWCCFFGATGEFIYHANFRSPRWLKYIVQTPELHSIHHELGVHNYNFGDIPLWDRLFGTYKDTDGFAERCGFPRDHERKLRDMLIFRSVY